MDETEDIKTKLDSLVQEQSARRQLLQRRGREIMARSHEYMTNQVRAAERYIQHRRELGRRAAAAAAPPAVSELDFEPEGHRAEAPAPFPAAPPLPRRAASSRRLSAQESDEEDDAFLNNRWRD